MDRILLANATVLASTPDSPKPFDGDVLIEDDKIVEVHPGRLQVADCRVVDLNGATLMPGLGDAHVHFGQPLNFEFDYYGAATMPLEDAGMSMAAVARQYIEHGVTTCLGGGNALSRADVALADTINRGWLIGPRILPSGEFISDPEGGIWSTAMPTSAKEMREIVARQCDAGVRVIKMFLSGENVMPEGAEPVDVDQSFLNVEMVEAAVDEASKHGAFVNAHARGASSVALAARCGVRIISHASYIDDEGLDLLQSRNDVWVCPGVHYLWAMSHVAPEPYLSKARNGGYAQEYEDAIKTIAQLAGAGITLVAGGDYGHIWQPHGGCAHDLEHFVDGAGMPIDAALLTATYNFGGLTRMPIGQVTPGYFADLVIIDGDPATDVKVLQDRTRRCAVIKAGRFAWVNPDRVSDFAKVHTTHTGA